MKQNEKDQIKQMFVEKCQLMGISQNQAAVMAGTKGATISQVFNGKYNADDSAIYRLIGVWVGFYKNDWQLVETNNFKIITNLLNDAKENQNVYALIGDAGCGKTATAKFFTASGRERVYVQCCEFWNRKQFLKEVLQSMGRDNTGMGMNEMLNSIVDAMKEGHFLLILDEADKLSDNVFSFFITLYNQLEDHAGIVMMATSHLEKRIMRGNELNRRGYAEIWSRIGRKFIRIPACSKNDIMGICQANGIDKMEQLKEIVDGSANDFRRTKRLVHKYKLINSQTPDL